MHCHQVLWVGLVAVLLMSCGPQSTPREAAPVPERGEVRQVSVPGKPLSLAATNEPAPLAGKFAGSSQREYTALFSAPLIALDYREAPTPILAEEVPSQDRGTWNVLPDGRMETTYRLRRAATWHDGTPFTAEDVAFTWRAIMHPEVTSNRTPERSMEAIEVLDPHSVLIRWKEPFIYANSYELIPMPRHILEPLLLQDPKAFQDSPYWTTEWVGLGPYRLAEWAPGSYLKGQAFSGYVLGAPRINEIFVYFVADANQAVARMLAGALDLTSGSVIKFDEGAILKRELEARGAGTAVPMRVGESNRGFELQFREPLGPWARDVRVRQAMAHALDRQVVIDTIHHGFTQIADMNIGQGDPAYQAADKVIRKYPYDPRRAQALLAEAGWNRGNDGMLANSAGERFDFEAWVTGDALFVKETEVFMDQWRAVGLNPQIEILSRATQRDVELRASFRGVQLGAMGKMPQAMEKWSAAQIAGPANRWTGRNRSGYANAEATLLAEDYFKTLDVQKRVDMSVQFLKIITEEAAGIFLNWDADVSAVRAGLKGLMPTEAPGDRLFPDNVHLWYWES